MHRQTRWPVGIDDIASRALLDLAGEQGLPITKKLSVASDFYMGPIYDDQTIYALDAQLFGPDLNGLLPPPRSSLESILTNSFRLHEGGLPVISGFFQLRNSRSTNRCPASC